MAEIPCPQDGPANEIAGEHFEMIQSMLAQLPEENRQMILETMVEAVKVGVALGDKHRSLGKYCLERQLNQHSTYLIHWGRL